MRLTSSGRVFSLPLHIQNEGTVCNDSLDDPGHRRNDTEKDRQTENDDSDPESGPVVSTSSIPIPLLESLWSRVVIGLLDETQSLTPRWVEREISGTLSGFSKLDIDKVLFADSPNSFLLFERSTRKEKIDRAFCLCQYSWWKQAVS